MSEEHAFTVKRRSPQSILVATTSTGAGWHQDFLLISDVHFDNPHCKRGLLKQHLDMAVERNAGIMIVGDWFDVMQSRDDPRRSKASLSPDYLLDYIDAVTEESATFLKPYAGHVVFVSEGNHESAIRKKLETNLTRRLARDLGVEYMRYSGWVQFRILEGGHSRRLVNLYFTHGSGGGGPVTKGVIQHNRRAAMLNDAQILVSGHIHEYWTVVNTVHGINNAGRPYFFDQLHISLPTYKEEFEEMEGYHTERGRPPKPLGGVWLRFKAKHGAPGRITYEALRAE